MEKIGFEYRRMKADKKKELIDLKKIEAKFQSEIFFGNILPPEKIIEAFISLTTRIKEKIPSYDTIISDEASARLVSLFFKKIIDKKKKDLKKPPVKIYFLNGGARANNTSRAGTVDFIKEKSADLGKVLLVTEYIENGGSVEFFANQFKENNIDFDIAALSISKLDWVIPKLESIDTKLYFGEIGPAGISFHKRESHLGVARERQTTKDATSANIPHPKRSTDSKFKDRDSARKDISILADELYKLIQ